MARGKTTYLIGALIICIIAILAVTIGLTAGGVVDLFSTTVTFRTGSATYEYDGLPKTLNQWSISKGALKKGHTAQVTVTGKQTEVGSSGNTISVAIFDKDGNDVTDIYSIKYDIGDIKVTKRVLEIESLDAEKEYDGQPLIADGYTITDGTLAPRQTIVATVTGSITDIGETDNTFDVKIMQDDADVSDNYDIRLKTGKLAVTKRKVTVKTADAQKVYDGKPLFDHGWEITSGSLLDGHRLDVEVTGVITEIGTTDNVASVYLDTGDESMANNYDLTVEFGKLKVALAEISVKTGSKSKIFDNKPLVCEEYEIVGGELKRGHTLTAKFANAAVEAGTYDNEAQFFVYDENKNDITDLYIINKEFGQLEISPLEVTFESEDESKEYDATPLVGNAETCKIIGGGLLEGHTVSFKMTGSQIDAGESDNTFIAIILDESGNNITSSYIVNFVYGKLKVTPAPLVVKSGSASKTYDGKPLTCNEVQAEGLPSSGGLKGNDYFDIDSIMFVNSQTDVGSIDNVVANIVIRNEEGNDVTGNYDIMTAWGKLTVLKAKLQVRAGSKTKADDGEPLTCDEFFVEPEENVADGEIVNAVIEGEQVGVGTSDNVVVSVSVTDASGNDKSFNYEITTKDGTLRITGERPNAPGLDTSGSTGGGSEGDESQENIVCMKIKSDKGGKIYLRIKSFGDYVGGWQAPHDFGRTLDGDYGFVYLTGTLLQESGFVPSKIEIENYTPNYLLPYYLSMQESAYEVQSNDIVFDGDTSQTYSVLFYAFDYVGERSKLGARSSYVSQESAYYGFAQSVYTVIPDSTRAYMDQIIAENGFDKNDPDVIGKVASYVQSAAEYSMKYDRSLDSQTDVAVAFLRDYKQGVCRHYATAATMLYRALGFPARYTIGYAADAKAGKWTEVTGKQGHAWTEVYVQGVGWVEVEVTGGDSAGGSGSGSGSGGGTGGSGSGTGEESGDNVLTLTPIPLIKEYHEEAIYLDASTIKTVTGFSQYEKKGYTYDVVCTGTLSQPGKGKSSIQSIKLYDPDGNDVTEEFQINFTDGELQLYLYEATITTEGAEKYYDGKELSNDKYTIEGLELGHVATVKTEKIQKEVGKIANDPTVSIVDASGDDQTDYYKIDKVSGFLTVKARKLKITSGSLVESIRNLDDEPLKCDQCTYTEPNDENGEGLAEGHTLRVVVSGSQDGLGMSDNTIESVVIVDRDGNDVTDNYALTLEEGKLIVMP